ncbi:MAG: MFS transporter, partial [Spirochaetales bacterium]|nr:MFS transporter [Spirochaetales bacterium]
MAFNQPSRMCLVPQLVEEEQLSNAVALNSAAMNVNRVLGPAGAGLLIAPLGIGGVYFASAGIYVVAIITTIMMKVPLSIPREVKTSVLTDMGEAFRYVYKEKSIFSLILLALIPMTLAQPYMTLMPIFADSVLGVGESGYGFLLSAVGTGALIAVLIIASLGRLRNKGLLILISIFCFGGFLVAFSQSTLFPVSLVIIAFAGFMSTGMMVLTNTSLLTIAPQELHGRVMAVYRLDHGLMPLGTMIMGLLADAIGAPATLLMMGGICALLALIMGIGSPRVRQIQ